jgi:choline dehydrogenase
VTPDGAAFDYVIVGAGSAGCLLADELSKAGAAVAVIEAGGRDRHPYLHIPAGYARILAHPRLTWGYRTAPDAATGMRALDYPRGRVLGGSSAINGLGHVWGDPSDYDLWAQKGLRGLVLGRPRAAFRRLLRRPRRRGRIAAGPARSASSTWRSCRSWWRGCAMPRPRSACRRRAT